MPVCVAKIAVAAAFYIFIAVLRELLKKEEAKEEYLPKLPL